MLKVAKKCLVCGNPMMAKGYCSKHYARLWRNGTLERKNRSWKGLPKPIYKSVSSMHKRRFGGFREYVIQRDGEMCTMCGLTRVEHKKIYKMDITVNHIDKQGRYAPVQNNDPDNMETLCLKCHGHKDAIQHGRYSTYSVNYIGKGE